MESIKHLFNHQTALENEMKYVACEFDKNTGKELLKEMADSSSHIANNVLPASIKSVSDNLVQVQVKVSVCNEMCKRLLSECAGLETVVQEEHVDDQFWMNIKYRKEQILEEFDVQKQILEDEYKRMVEQIKRENSIP